MTPRHYRSILALLYLALLVAGCDSGISDPISSDPEVVEEPARDPNPLEGQAQMIWVDLLAGTIQRANLDGSGITDIVSGLRGPRDIAIDIEGGKMYWSDGPESAADYPETSKIQRANLDGSDIEDLFIDQFAYHDLALEVNSGKMYWAFSGVDPFTGRIRRANLDGTNVEDVLTRQIIRNDIMGLYWPHGLELDTTAGKMYWIQAGQIQRNNIDGSDLETLVTDLELPDDLVLDIDGGMMYWTGRDKIQRATLDGSNIEDLVLIDQENGRRIPLDLALDVKNDRMYWTVRSIFSLNGAIQRANLNGSNVETLVTNLMRPTGIALIPEVITP